MKRASLTEEIFKSSKPAEERKEHEEKERKAGVTRPARQRKYTSAGTQAYQQTLTDEPPVKKTYYFDQETLAILERERFNRRTAGQRIGSDFSALIREAVKKTFG